MEPVPPVRFEGPAVEGPDFEEARPVPHGPRLPAIVRILPMAAWPFVLLAVMRLGWGLHEAGLGPAIDPWQIGQVVLFELPSVISVLLPAALLARHRDAGSRTRMLLVGMLAIVIVEGLRVSNQPLQPFFAWLTPGDQGVTFLVPSALAYQVGINLLNASAVAAIALGLTRARRFEDRSRSWPVAAVLVVPVVLVAVTGIVSISRLPAEQLPMTATVVAYIVSTVVLNVLSATAFGYLAAATTAGARAGEDPSLGWLFGAVGSWLVIGSLAALGMAGLAEATPANVGLLDGIVQVIEAVFSIGFVGLLLAFVLGLPALDPAGNEHGAGARDGRGAGSGTREGAGTNVARG